MCVNSTYLATNSSCKFRENIQNIFHSLKQIYFFSMTYRQCKRLYNIYYYLTCPNITPIILYRYITPVVYKMVKRNLKLKMGAHFIYSNTPLFSLSWANTWSLSPRESRKFVKYFTDCLSH